MDLQELSNAVITGNQAQVKELTQQAIDEGIEILAIINEGLIPGMTVVGKRFKAGDMFVPEVLMAARSMHEGMNLVKPLLTEQDNFSAGTIVLGTVEGDLHDIGKNLVGMMLESAGFTVIDIGIDVPSHKFAEKVKEAKPDILALSALLTTTMHSMKNVIDVLIEMGLRDDVKVIVGGAPVSEEFANEISADGYAPDAASAVELAENLMKQTRMVN